MCTTLQLALMPGALEDRQAFVLGGGKIRVGLARQMQAEPLASQCLAVLQSRVADHLQRHASGAGDAFGSFLGVQVALFHPQPEVFALAGQRNVEHLIDLKILRDRLQHRAAARLAMRQGTEQLVFGHARTSKAMACTAIPSSRPVKPSFSVVVAFTLT